MKFTLHLLLIALFVVFVCASAPQKQIIVSYPKGTPDHIVEEAMDEIKKAVSRDFTYDWFVDPY